MPFELSSISFEQLSLSVRYLNARLVQTSFRRASLGLLAVLLGLELGFEPRQSGKTDIRHIVMMVGILVQIGTALRAQTLQSGRHSGCNGSDSTSVSRIIASMSANAPFSSSGYVSSDSSSPAMMSISSSFLLLPPLPLALS